MYARARLCIHTQAYAYTHTQTYAYTHAQTYAYTRTQAYACTHTQANAYTHTSTHYRCLLTRTHTYAHTLKHYSIRTLTLSTFSFFIVIFFSVGTCASTIGSGNNAVSQGPLDDRYAAAICASLASFQYVFLLCVSVIYLQFIRK